MFIKKLHIYGYGKIVDQELILSKGLQIFWGENEAGKSTIMSFIHSLLFGFPTKGQSENKYEPKDGLRYGGKMLVETNQHGVITIERVAGKAAGVVSVYFENGTVGHEEELAAILHGMNKRLYSSIFSFGLKGLQDIQSVKTDDLSHYLFSSSILGNEQILELEKKIGREMEALFKPSGKKPEINQILEETVVLSQQVNVAKSQLVDYQNLIEAKLEIEKKIVENTSEMERLSELDEKLNLFEQFIPLRNEILSLSMQQDEIGEKPVFPIDGLNRFEKITSLLLPTVAKVRSFNEKYADINEKYLQITLNDNLLNTEMEIRELANRNTSKQIAENRYDELKIKIETIEEEAIGIIRRLGIKLTNEEIIQIELPLSIKEEIRGFTDHLVSIRNKKELLDQQKEEIKRIIELAESNSKHYREQLLDENKKRELEKLIQQSQSLITENEKKQIISKYDRIMKQLNGFERRRKNVRLLRNTVFLPVSICLLIFGIVSLVLTGNSLSYITLLSSLALFVGVGILSKPQNQYISLLKDEQKELEIQMQGWNAEIKSELDNIFNVEEAQQLLANDGQIQQLLQKETISLQQHEKEFERSIDQFEKWEQASVKLLTQFEKIKKKLHIPEHFGPELVMEFYNELEKLITLLHQLNKFKKEANLLKDQIKEYLVKYSAISQRINLNLNVNSPQLFVQLLEDEKIKKQQVSFMMEKQKELKETIDQYSKEAEYYSEQIESLFSTANVDNEEEYRRKASLLEKWNELEGKISNLKGNVKFLLNNNSYLEKEFVRNWDNLNQKLQERDSLSTQQLEYKHSEKKLLADLMEIAHEKKLVEEKGTYSSLLQLLETKKSELNYIAKKWAKLAIGKDILIQTKDYYRKVRLPQVIEKAEYYFSILTNGAYIRLFSHEETSDFIVERKDGVRFKPHELSQATAEQLYLSLRVALASYFQSPVILPFIVDDGFVNFDETRLRLSMDLLRELSKERQVIFFTCHNPAINNQITEDGNITYLTNSDVKV